MNRILIVEDDTSIQTLLSSLLQNAGYHAEACGTGQDALQWMITEAWDLCILDVNLPDMNGFSLCRRIRETCRIPILFLTIRDDESSILTGLEAGADDYVTKPFSAKVLLGRIHAHLRRNQLYQQSDDAFYHLDQAGRQLWVRENPIPLSPSEYRIVKLLITQKGCLVTREQILNSIWDGKGNFVEENTLSVSISRLRRKIAVDGHQPIETVHGLGYRWNEEEP